MRRLLIAALALALCGCEKLIRIEEQPPDPPPLRHIGVRSDVRGREGNSFFDDARYTADGSLLVTLRQDSVRVWDAKSGELRSTFQSQLPEPGNWMLDSRTKRFVGRNAREALEVFDLETGRRLVEFPAEEHPPNWSRKIKALALGADSNTVILGQAGGLMLWGMFPPRPLRSVAINPPEHDFVPRCAGVPENAAKKCWERSPDGHWLALAFTSERSRNEGTRLYLVDAASLAVRDLMPPDGMWRELEDRAMVGFAFSGDSQRLAIGTSWGIWVYEVLKDRWTPFISGKDSTRTMYGPWLKLLQRGVDDSKPGLYLGAMAFSRDGRRLIALGNGMQSYIFDAATGHRMGLADIPSQGFQGSFRVSTDGSRIVIFRLGTSLLEVRNGRDASQIGWICPGACQANERHAQLTYAVSPNGRAVAVSHRGQSAAVWATDTDAQLFPLIESPAAH